MDGHIARVRSFNRTVTKRIGALDSSFMGRGFPLGHARILYELGPGPQEVRVLRRKLELDAGYVSRMLSSLERKGLAALRADLADGRVRIVELTEAGRAELAQLEHLSDEGARSLLANLSASHQDQLVAAMEEVERLLCASDVQLAVEEPDSERARWCLEEYFRELDERFEDGFDPMRSLPADGAELTPPVGHFVVASRAHEAGAHALRLETNDTLDEAQALYLASGFLRVEPFNDERYAHHWFEKSLPSSGDES